MSRGQNRALQLIYLVLGIAVPITGFLLWSKSYCCRARKAQVDKARDITVEESFPASDPPSSW